MYQLSKPKFKFELFLVENSKNGSFIKRVHCFADTYEVNEGTVTFFQAAKSNDKLIKLPVLSYPAGKWEALALVDDNNYYPVFNQYNPTTFNYAADNSNPDSKTNDGSEPEESGNTNSNENYGNLPSNSRSPVGLGGGQFSTPHGFNNNMPGVNNPQEFKKSKNEWLEKAIKDYVKITDNFKNVDFIRSLQKDSLFRQYKPTETDVDWTASNLIKERLVVSRKFSDPSTQKILALILPDIMKRQWNGKMAVILEILHAKEEAKNVTAIDLAVWMAQNNVT